MPYYQILLNMDLFYKGPSYYYNKINNIFN